MFAQPYFINEREIDVKMYELLLLPFAKIYLTLIFAHTKYETVVFKKKSFAMFDVISV